MITGFNTDVDYQQRVFHVQTEDKGVKNPYVESLIYTGGEIVASRQSSYADLAESGGYSEDEVLRRMELQHQTMIREIFNGKYDQEEPRPFGHSIITNRTLDEVVAEFLEAHLSIDHLKLEMIDEEHTLVEGTRPTLRMRLIDEDSSDPVSEAQVVIELITTRGQPREVFSGMTDGDGYLEASFEIPNMPGANAAIVCRAEAAGNDVELRQLVEKA